MVAAEQLELVVTEGVAKDNDTITSNDLPKSYGVFRDGSFIGVALFDDAASANDYFLELVKDEYHQYSFTRLN